MEAVSVLFDGFQTAFDGLSRVARQNQWLIWSDLKAGRGENPDLWVKLRDDDTPEVQDDSIFCCRRFQEDPAVGFLLLSRPLLHEAIWAAAI